MHRRLKLLRQKHQRQKHQKLRQHQRAHREVHRRQSLQNRFRLHRKQKLQGQNPRDQLHSRTETTASSVREMARATVISVRAKAATIIAGTEMEAEADLAREDHRAAMAARVDSAETEIMMVREDL